MVASNERKLTTIVSADFVGYSRLMSQDEAGTLATLKTYRVAMAKLIADCRGRIFSTAGDSVLAEFPSVVQAVTCATQIQRELGERNATLPPERQMRLRIGVNLGDVLVEADDLYGDGVNVAARLQSLAEPDGILISGTVFDHVKDKLSLGFDYLGPQAVKNITNPVPAYRVVLQGGGAAAVPVHREPPAPAPTADKADDDQRRRRFYVSAASAGALIVLLFAIDVFSGGRGLWFHWPTLGILFMLTLRAIKIFWK
jgi:adenylate cyclase